MNDKNFEERKQACDCDPKELLAKEREYMKTPFSQRVNYVFCSKHFLLVPFEWEDEKP